MELFDALKVIRLKNNLTQQQVADFLGISRSAYCGYEIGRRKMSVKMLSDIAKMYNLSVDVMVSGDSTSVHEQSAYQTDNLYLSELTDTEQDVILKYRKMSEEQKAKLAQLLTEED